jgi:hypothetical protein
LFYDDCLTDEGSSGQNLVIALSFFDYASDSTLFGTQRRALYL